MLWSIIIEVFWCLSHPQRRVLPHEGVLWLSLMIHYNLQCLHHEGIKWSRINDWCFSVDSWCTWSIRLNSLPRPPPLVVSWLIQWKILTRKTSLLLNFELCQPANRVKRKYITSIFWPAPLSRHLRQAWTEWQNTDIKFHQQILVSMFPLKLNTYLVAAKKIIKKC